MRARLEIETRNKHRSNKYNKVLENRVSESERQSLGLDKRKKKQSQCWDETGQAREKEKRRKKNTKRDKKKEK